MKLLEEIKEYLIKNCKTLSENELCIENGYLVVNFDDCIVTTEIYQLNSIICKFEVKILIKQGRNLIALIYE